MEAGKYPSFSLFRFPYRGTRLTDVFPFSYSLVVVLQTVVEADADTGELHGTVSMSAQFAPYDAKFRKFRCMPCHNSFHEGTQLTSLC